MKKFMTEFKEFIAKGNVMAMAVGIIIGGAFKAIIDSVVADIISPIIGLVLGGLDFSQVSFGVGDAQIMIGNLINSIISFLITAIVLFFMVKAYNRFEESRKEPAPEEEPEVPEDIQLLTEIRDLLKK